MDLMIRILLFLFYVIEAWVASYFVIVIVFVLLDLLKIRFSKPVDVEASQGKSFNFAAIVPLHQNIDFLAPILDSLFKQTYKNVHIFIIADDCPRIHVQVQDERVHIIYPETPLHSKIKSLQLALQQVDEQQFDAMAIFDADNLIHPNFFKVVNAYFNHGFRAFQSNILPKNTDTTFARLDAINDQYYNFIDRLAPAQLALNAHVAGRGTVVDVKMYKAVSYNSFFGGFDKKLQCEIAKQTVIGYSEKAILFDEKVNSGADMQVQRTRWINAYFRYFTEAAKIFRQGLAKGNFRLAFFGYNNMRPPLFIQLVLAVVLVAADVAFVHTTWVAWAVIFGLYFLSFFYITVLTNKVLDFATCVKTIFRIPLFFIRQIRALLNIKKANKKFMQTNNFKVVFIDEVLQGGV